MRIAAYCRISTDERNQPYSLDMQQDKIEKYVEFQEDNWKLVRIIKDAASAKDLERPGMQELLHGIRTGAFDCVLVYRLDRLSRRLADTCFLVKEMSRHGVTFRSVTESYENATPTGRMMLHTLGTMAEYERDLICERTRADMTRKAELGEWCGGFTPYGYDYTKEGKTLLVNPAEAPIVLKVFSWYVRDLIGTKAIALKLNEAGFRTRYGKQWHVTRVISMIRNPVYTGIIRRNGIDYPGKHEPLVPKETWEKAQRIMDRRGECPSLRRSNASRHLLSGLLTCGRCGRPLVGVSANGNGGKYRYYICSGRQKFKKCRLDTLRKDSLEQAVLGRLKNVFTGSGLIERVHARAAELLAKHTPDYDGELTAVSSEIKKKELAIRRYQAAFESGDMPAKICGDRLRDIGVELEQLNAKFAEIERAKVAGAELKPGPELHKAVARLHKTIMSAPLAKRKAAIKMLVKKIKVRSRDLVEATFRLPLVRNMSMSAPRTGLELDRIYLVG